MSSNRRSDILMTREGFTLLEVLIAVAIFAMISLGIFIAQKQTFRTARTVQVEGDFYNGIRFAMELFNRDVTSMYTPSMFLPPKKKSTTPAGQPNPFGAPTPEPTETPDPNEETKNATQFFLPPDKYGIRLTRFQGSRDKMSFVSTSHSRIYKDAKETEFAKISYELQRDQRKGALPETSILVKSESTNIWDEKDDEKDPLLRHYRLLPGVKNIQFRYCKYADKELKCENNWDSDNTDYKGLLPDMVEVTIEVVGPERLTFKGSYKFRPEVPLRGLNPST